MIVVLVILILPRIVHSLFQTSDKENKSEKDVH